MALKKADEKKEAAQGFNIEVTRAKRLESGSIGFDMTVNGIKIYGCFAKTVKSKKTGEDVDLVSFPQYKGTNGNYYDYVWFPMTLKDKDNIIDQINSLLS